MQVLYVQERQTNRDFLLAATKVVHLSISYIGRFACLYLAYEFKVQKGAAELLSRNKEGRKEQSCFHGSLMFDSQRLAR